MTYRIFDTATGHPYIARDYATRLEACRALADLVRPYPRGHAWRERLRVEAAAGPRLRVGASWRAGLRSAAEDRFG